MNFLGKKVLVVGAGKSGISAIELLSQEGAQTILYDANAEINKEETKLTEFREKLPKNYNGDIILGEFPSELKSELDMVVLSPGVPTDLDYVKDLKSVGIPIIGEVELAYNFSKGKIAAITGTNGKTTTTTLVGEIMKTYYKSVFVVGNIGVPYTQMVKNTEIESVTVAEMSSFQLETVENFRPDVSAILNITPDHLNRHHTMEAYIEAKVNVTKNQTKEDTCVLNYEDSYLQNVSGGIPATILWFSSARELESGLFLQNNQIIYRDDEKECVVCDVNELQIIGKHNYENVMAAVGIAIALKVPMEDIHKALIEFKGVEHRIEYVTTKRGVKYYNDSKGTNPDASIQAIKAMQTKTLLIGGGYDKDSDYDDWIKAFDDKVTYLVLLGQTREKIANAAKRLGVKNIVLVDSLSEAVTFCAEHAGVGETVLLSPCCASWGMFKDYEERGMLFKEYVHALKDE
ncbi:MAG TPA: UDP-N-acetylmuramoyl-L-alanine--D-glutamate ligase [Lachnoclostridium phytofermentans]|uniref:UDP-N-acetylmuramoylalanine--D-glutamate ligase n=1 Tax=Lachnoclostridium phytofermentans TaxID=66219 RepID=A0A3D2X313_9FIRM|nr:UDP-N-acetylmuramoyl-L-alanine--D-glutamate ligase [Lachnoclostridium sp.]HCL01023.1 UDP-N-acetylmuramoyl-L-alanine--D-glutamate ligase [Lachnoclostridium phytofermentans]